MRTINFYSPGLLMIFSSGISSETSESFEYDGNLEGRFLNSEEGVIRHIDDNPGVVWRQMSSQADIGDLRSGWSHTGGDKRQNEVG